MVSCKVLVPQFLWFRAVRDNLLVVWVLSIFINIGMWFERFVIIVTSLHRDFLPSSWTEYVPTKIEVATLLGASASFSRFSCFSAGFCRSLRSGRSRECSAMDATGREVTHEQKAPRCLR
jgi:hypothetical protein